MIEKYFAIFTFMILLSFPVNSQTKNVEVHFTDGSFTKGEIIEESSDSVIGLKFPSGKIKYFNRKDISQIILYGNNETNNINGIQFVVKIGHLSNGHMYYRSLSDDVSTEVFLMGIGISNLISKNIRAGIDVELNTYPNALVLPIYGDVRLRYDGELFSPFLAINFGYSLAWIKGLRGMNGDGLYFSGGLGMEIIPFKTTAIVLEGAYTFQGSESIVSNYSNPVSIDTRYTFYKLSVGLIF